MQNRDNEEQKQPENETDSDLNRLVWNFHLFGQTTFSPAQSNLQPAIPSQGGNARTALFAPAMRPVAVPHDSNSVNRLTENERAQIAKILAENKASKPVMNEKVIAHLLTWQACELKKISPESINVDVPENEEFKFEVLKFRPENTTAEGKKFSFLYNYCKNKKATILESQLGKLDYAWEAGVPHSCESFYYPWDNQNKGGNTIKDLKPSSDFSSDKTYIFVIVHNKDTKKFELRILGRGLNGHIYGAMKSESLEEKLLELTKKPDLESINMTEIKSHLGEITQDTIACWDVVAAGQMHFYGNFFLGYDPQSGGFFTSSAPPPPSTQKVIDLFPIFKNAQQFSFDKTIRDKQLQDAIEKLNAALKLNEEKKLHRLNSLKGGAPDPGSKEEDFQPIKKRKL